MRLCSHPYPAEELARKDDLALLFLAITSWCPQYNVMWRKSAAEVLMTLSRHGLTQNVVAYIHSKFHNVINTLVMTQLDYKAFLNINYDLVIFNSNNICLYMYIKIVF